jgi:hypothetical protein
LISIEGFFGLHKKLADTADTETIVRGLDLALDLNPVFPYHITVLFGISVFVVNVPAQEFEEFVDEIGPGLGLIVMFSLILFDIVFKKID